MFNIAQETQVAQSSLTTTPENPSYPSNFPSTGAFPANPPNFTKVNYANPFNMSPINSGAGGTMTSLDGRPVQTTPGVGVNPNPPPYYDDGVAQGAPINEPAGSRVLFATNVAALAGGTGATSGGTEGTFPGTDTAPYDTPNGVGPVPASTSVAHEGAGSELLVTQTYSSAIFLPAGPLLTVSTGPTLTANVMPQPNATHASSLSKATAPALASITPTTAVSGTGTTALTAVTGTNFTPQSVVYANGVPIPTVYVSATTLTATMPKKSSAGTWPITVVSGGVIVTAPQTFTWT
jgi:IPT/TIG domain